MRGMKKLVSVILALAMVLGTCMSAFAADTTYTITITSVMTGHTYEAYQIFTGDLYEVYTEATSTQLTDGTQLYTYDTASEEYTGATYDTSSGKTYYVFEKNVLSNIKWGDGVDGTALLTALKADNTAVGSSTVGTLFANCKTAADVAEVLSGNNGIAALAEAFAQIASEHLTTTVAGTSTQTTTAPDSDGNYTYTISNLTAGYYLVKDKDNSVTGSGEFYTDIILEVVANVTVAAKAGTTKFDKEVESTTDVAKTGTTPTYGDTTADYDIGDSVPFTLTATLPSNYASYKVYKMTFHDTLSAGLSFNKDSVKVTVTTTTTVGNTSTTTTTVVARGYSVVTYGYQVAAVTETNFDPTNSTYYTYDSETKTYTEVDSSATFDADTVYYTYAGDCYHVANITEFADGSTYSTSGSTKYYTLVSGVYTEVTNGAAFDDTETYYVKANCTFEVQIADTNALYDENNSLITVNSTSVIVVTYNATLTADASTEETNAAYLEFSNDPNNADGSGTGTTTEETNTVFTFTLDVNKIDEDGYPLTGAGFTLYKQVYIDAATSFDSSTTYYTFTDEKITVVTDISTATVPGNYYVAIGSEVTAGNHYQIVSITEFESGVTYYTYNTQNERYEKVTDTSGTPVSGTDYYVYAKNQFIFDGLAVGNYVLSETTTPDGYNTLDDLYFTITAETEKDAKGNAYVKTLIIKNKDGNVISDGTKTFTVSTDDKTLSTTITNYSGSVLPATGGIGTTIFYVVGCVLVLGAAVLLITRRRMKGAAR